jgi:hypothetical protein
MAKNFLGKELLICRYHSNKHKCQGMEQTSMLKILEEKEELFLDPRTVQVSVISSKVQSCQLPHLL